LAAYLGWGKLEQETPQFANVTSLRVASQLQEERRELEFLSGPVQKFNCGEQPSGPFPRHKFKRGFEIAGGVGD
jgi:hypothetical protein